MSTFFTPSVFYLFIRLKKLRMLVELERFNISPNPCVLFDSVRVSLCLNIFVIWKLIFFSRLSEQVSSSHRNTFSAFLMLLRPKAASRDQSDMTQAGNINSSTTFQNLNVLQVCSCSRDTITNSCVLWSCLLVDYHLQSSMSVKLNDMPVPVTMYLLRKKN